MSSSSPHPGLKIIHTYLDAFCRADPDRIGSVLHDDFTFEGPLLRTEGAEAYLAALRGGEPVETSFRVRDVFSDGPRVCVFYTLTRGGRSTEMAQVFELRGEKITASRLVFDTAFLEPGG